MGWNKATGTLFLGNLKQRLRNRGSRNLRTASRQTTFCSEPLDEAKFDSKYGKLHEEPFSLKRCRAQVRSLKSPGSGRYRLVAAPPAVCDSPALCPAPLLDAPPTSE